MYKYIWLLDLMAQTIFAITFTLLSGGTVLAVLGSI